jgi:hypothetical protein
MSKTLGLEPLKKFLRYTLYSGFVQNKKRPVSALIIAHPERAKSTEVLKFEGIGILYMTDLTHFGLMEELKEMTEKQRAELHHLVLPDLEKLRSRGRSVREELMASFRDLMEEGLKSMHTGKIDVKFNPPVVMGVVACTTPEDIGDRRSVLRNVTLQSRFIPFGYDYSAQQKIDVLNFVEKEDELTERKDQISGKVRRVELPESLAHELTPYAVFLALRIQKFCSTKSIDKKDSLFGVRAKENLMTLLKSIALYNGNRTVTREDFRELMGLYKYMNFNFRELEYQ